MRPEQPQTALPHRADRHCAPREERTPRHLPLRCLLVTTHDSPLRSTTPDLRILSNRAAPAEPVPSPDQHRPFSPEGARALCGAPARPGGLERPHLGRRVRRADRRGVCRAAVLAVARRRALGRSRRASCSARSSCSTTARTARSCRRSARTRCSGRRSGCSSTRRSRCGGASTRSITRPPATSTAAASETSRP